MTDGGGHASQSIEDSPKCGDKLESVLAAAVGHYNDPRLSCLCHFILLFDVVRAREAEAGGEPISDLITARWCVAVTAATRTRPGPTYMSHVSPGRQRSTFWRGKIHLPLEFRILMLHPS